MAFDKALGGLALFGGSQAGSGNPDYNDAWMWDGSNWTQLNPAGTPAARDTPSLWFTILPVGF